MNWISVLALAVGLGLSFVAGFMSGLLWERGTAVRRVLTGEDPPPWDDPNDVVFIPTDWNEPISRSATNTNPTVRIWDPDYRPHLEGPHISTRPDVYDHERDGL